MPLARLPAREQLARPQQVTNGRLFIAVWAP